MISYRGLQRGEVPLHWPSADGLEVDQDQPVVGAKAVPEVRFPVNPDRGPAILGRSSS